MNWKLENTKLIIQSIRGNILYVLPSPIKELLKFARNCVYQLRLYKLCFLKKAFPLKKRISSNPLDGPAITVCIPAYQSQNWIRETFSSLEKQTFRNFHVLISVDGEDLDTLEMIRPFLQNPKYEIHVQKERLGWVNNTNWLLQHAKTPFVCVLPHDDLLHPLYSEELLNHLHKHRKCALVYSDIRILGPDASFKRRYITQSSVKGSPFQRMETYLLKHYKCVGFRGLIRREILNLSGYIDTNPFHHFAADTNWIGKIVKYGEIHRIPVALYTKRYHANNTHTKWFEQTKDEQKAAWNAVCQELLNDFLKTTGIPEEQERLKKAYQIRFKQGCLDFRIEKMGQGHIQ